MTADVNITSNIKLLPLPEKSEIDRHIPTGVRMYGYTTDDMKTYASACVAHATAARGAEVEALRAEAVKLRNLRADAIHECALANVRAEQLAEALRKIAALKERESDELRDAVGIANEALEQEK